MYQLEKTRTTDRPARRALSRITRGLLASCAAVAMLLVGTVAPAVAGITGYRVTGTGGAGLTVRTNPHDAGAPSVALLADGTYFTAECAVRGRNIYGNTVWHQISAPVTGWISDYYTTTPGFNQYLPGEPECGTGTPPPTGTREDRALAWARSVLGHTHTNGDLGDSNHPWDGWCDNFVAHAYGRAASGYATALVHFNALNARGLIRTTGTPPAGALVFYNGAAINGYAGHVMLSEGNGNYITTAATVRRVSLTWPGAPYLGWSYADPEWPGR
ncbi:hypothetical protein [Micromonospora sp. NBC_01813]|uniref:hypothetical protein n=1 Tax=Micromonospora sp. NBC_01813 TaxID=2975988 RepID=UPI002DD9D7DD|nr:hypothetical protein [Micromonospora sp. NBC_01813]WSA10172.1 hypothetical protein OG958_05075 [Micromonospora sp. NBC_01813]